MKVKHRLLLELRRKHKMTQQELGEQLNKAKETISRYENGVKNPSLQTLCAYSEVFGVTIDELIEKKMKV
ncbi:MULTISPECIES: helix-turn-helix domain-containing protein [Bacillus]|uniref:Helix-turn-helix transcriptional regulator n=1 Tax=Bacillus dicomae TaxID=3088378 RepID=A0AC61T7D7_9BACI|nr:MULTISPECIES: helix-turn-helix transcriptional regulator [Bacillus]PKJ55156.1 XRE family transcriptional regulator [Bacillus sp. SN10]TPV44549.1 helix-turn-helix transcriptional regulator [Bacillus dicomae]